MIKEKLSEQYMNRAIKEAAKNLRSMHGGPFGACIVRNGKILAACRNTVLKNDATCHAEINAIRQASRKIKSFDLSGAVIYSTTEPCPMCFSAIHWAGIQVIVYGTTIHDAARSGFRELKIRNTVLKSLGKSTVEIHAGYMVEACQKLFRAWDALSDKRVY
jgi:tRNA(Arg) A34 adenosine deaminase TadA